MCNIKLYVGIICISKLDIARFTALTTIRKANPAALGQNDTDINIII